MQVRVTVGIVTGLHDKTAGSEQQGETQAGSEHDKTSIRLIRVDLAPVIPVQRGKTGTLERQHAL